MKRCSLTELLRIPTGPEISREKFQGNALIAQQKWHPLRIQVSSLQDMLTATNTNNSNSKNLEGEPIRRVIKRGLTTTTSEHEKIIYVLRPQVHSPGPHGFNQAGDPAAR